MSKTVAIGGTDGDRVYIDTDFTKRFFIYDWDTTVVAPGTTMKNILGMALAFDVRKNDYDEDADIKIFKTVGDGLQILGVYDPDPTVNTQHVLLTVLSTDLTVEKFTSKGGKNRYSLKRIDPGSETIFNLGDFIVERATQRGAL